MTSADNSSRAVLLFAGAVLGAAVVIVVLSLAASVSTVGVWGPRDFAIAGAAAAAAVVTAVYAAAHIKRSGQRLLDAIRRHALPLFVLALIMLWLVVYLATDIFISISPGQGGVMWKRFGGGTVTERVYGEGLHVIPPWDSMTIYDLRYQQHGRDFEVLSSDGLLYSVEVTVRFRLRPESLGLLHKCVGPNYVDTMLLPEVGSVARLVTAQMRPDELYTSQRHASELEIRKRLRLEIGRCASRQRPTDVADTFDGIEGQPQAGERYFEASEVFIRRIVLPPKLAEAIEAKLVQRQKMLEYDYRIDSERKEAQRKAIEAEGIRAYNETIGRTMSANVLQWHGLDATLELAKSPNSKVVIIGSNRESGPPLMLGQLPAVEPAPAPRERRPRRRDRRCGERRASFPIARRRRRSHELAPAR